MDREAAFGPDLTGPAQGNPSGQGMFSGGGSSRYASIKESGRFRLGKKIGEGGMGIVYEAFDTNLSRNVAVKIMRGEYHGNHEALERFFHEAEILGAMDHPGMLPVYETGVLHGSREPFYAMKLVQGKTLLDLLNNRDVADQENSARLVRYFLEACQAVACAHAHKIVHRDLKPSNIMIAEYGEVLVIDWGLAKRIDSDYGITRPGGVMGTPGHMSPEQASGDAFSVDTRSDVFVLGIILYQILTGQRPFAAPSAAQVHDLIVSHNPPEPRSINRACSRELNAICLKALRKNQEERYRNANELAQDIQNALDGRPVSAYRRTLRDKAVRWAGHHPRASTALAIASTLALVLAVALFTLLQAGTLMQIMSASIAERYLAYMNQQLDAYDHALHEAETQLAAFQSHDSAEYLKLKMEADILRGKREVHKDWIQLTIAGLVGKYSNNLVDPISGLRPELKEQVKHMARSDARRAIDEDDLFKAHFIAWQTLERDTGLDWTPAEVTEWINLREQIEGMLETKYGDILEIPDWQASDPAQVLVQMLLGEETRAPSQYTDSRR